MKIYIAHSRGFDYQNDLYAPLRACADLPQAEIILPHESETHVNNTRDFYRELDLMIAEVSFPATGLGIELGWAADDRVPIHCVYRAGCEPSGSLYAVTDKFDEYSTSEELMVIITNIINKTKKDTK